MIEIVMVGILALAAGLAIGWLVASRRGQALASDLAVAQARAADAEIVRAARDAVERERNEAMQEVSRLRAQAEERQASHEATVRQLNEARDAMTAQFNAAAAKALESAQAQFLERADARFRQSEESAGQNLKSMLQPVSDRLQRPGRG